MKHREKPAARPGKTHLSSDSMRRYEVRSPYPGTATVKPCRSPRATGSKTSLPLRWSIFGIAFVTSSSPTRTLLV